METTNDRASLAELRHQGDVYPEGGLMLLAATPFFRSFAPVTLTYLTHLTNNSDTTNYSLGNVSVPRAGLLAYIVYGRGTGVGNSWSSSTIGGGSATRHAFTSNGRNPIAIFSREVSAGTHAVAAVCASALNRAGADLWLIENYRSTTPTSTDLTDGDASASGSRSVTLSSIKRGGCGIYAGLNNQEVDAWSWSGATERFDAGTGEVRMSAADKETASLLSSNVVSASFGSGFGCIAGASWR
ncbi:hypothetical protein PRN20_04505 [Devosia sp. ZB163]|uniref:hypothetical protein n=1 Tax=Devosia sp. ZB163 TaxID=3025938 RepID=UPI0023627C0C|nr:hypothetical protein [Devosia sp. ZB163]MDC9822983.1 hypothetical protein [Devosia sp. ZB163]